MLFGGFLFLVAKDVLDFLHTEAALVEEGAASVAGQMPMEVLLDAGELGYLADRVVAIEVAAYVGQVFECAVLTDEEGGFSAPKGVDGDLKVTVGFLLVENEDSAAKIG